MFYDMNKLFSIGQFAKLHEINKKTLMWYDEIGLLKPAVIKENGYRYYTYQQSSILETILMLRELDVSISDIQSFLETRSAFSLENLLTEKLSELDKTISHLMALKKIMLNKRQDMIDIRSLDLNVISIIEKKHPIYLATVDVSEGLPFETEIEKVINETKKYQLRRLHDASYGAMLPIKKLYNGQTSDYEFLYIQMPNPVQKDGLHIQPAGKYLRAFCKGSWDKLADRYAEILAYAQEHGLELCGFAYEKGINDIVIDTLDDYITQIEIPVKVKPLTVSVPFHLPV